MIYPINTTNLITNYQDFQNYLQTNVVVNPKIKEKSTVSFQDNDKNPLALFIPKNFDKNQFKNLGKNVKIKTFIESNNDINVKTLSVYQFQNNDLFLLVDNENSFSNINYENIWYCLHELRKHLSNSNTKLSIIKQHYNPQIKWEMIYPMLRYIFKDKQIDITILNNDLIIPSDSEKETILKELHDNPLRGHQGVSRTFKKISKLYTWRGMKKRCQKVCKKV